MITPVRLQLSRRAGARLVSPNGLPIVRVSRPGPWGNPFPWKGDWIVWAAVARGFRADEPGRRAAAVAIHREWLLDEAAKGPHADDPGDDLIEFESGVALSTAEAARGIAATMAMISSGSLRVPRPPALDALRAALRGSNLVCWCHLCGAHRRGKPLGEACAACDPCHADTCLEIANPHPELVEG